MKKIELLEDFPPVESVSVDCNKGRAEGCKTKCCSFWFALTPREVEEGIIKFNPEISYMIMQDNEGYCVHLDRKTLQCTIWGKRPDACKEYSCENDERVWGKNDRH